MLADFIRLRLAVLGAIALVATAPAQAQLFRAYLSAAGADTNPCTLPAPCRLLPAALAAVADGGEIWLLDSANYNTGPVPVAKSVTILAVPGVLGSVVASGGNALNIAGSGINVTLRNLNIRPLPGNGGNTGVAMTSGAQLTIRNCEIFGFSGGRGLHVTSATQVFVVDSLFRGNSVGAEFDTARARIARSQFVGAGAYLSSAGIVARGSGGIVTVTDSVVSGFNLGIIATSLANQPTRLFVRDTVVESNNYGVQVYVATGTPNALAEATVSSSLVNLNNFSGLHAEGPGARMIVSGSTVSTNWWGFQQANGAVFESAGNNTVRSNIVPTLGAITGVGTM